MADLVPNAALSRIVLGATDNVILAEAVDFGMPIFKRSGKMYRSSAAIPEAAECDGIAWSNGEIGDTIPMLTLQRASVSLGTALLPSTPYVVSANVGRIAPYGDLTGAEEIIQLGIADGAGELLSVKIHETDIPGLGGGADQGAWDASTNTPDLAGTAPHNDLDYWTVSVGGVQTLGDLTNQQWNPGDIAQWRDAVSGNWVRIAAPLLAGVNSFNGRDGTVVSIEGDYAASLVTNDSGVAGSDTADALNTLDGKIGATDGNLAAHVGDLANPHQVSAAQTGAPTQAELDAHTGDASIHYADAPSDGTTYGRKDGTWVEAEIPAAMTFRGEYKDAQGAGPFAVGDVVTDVGWLMHCDIANSADRPAPQPIGTRFLASEVPGSAPVFTEADVSTPSLYVGQRYTFPGALFGYAIGFWIPSEIIGFKCELFSVNDPLGNADYRIQVPEFTIAVGETEQWVARRVGEQIVPTGTVFDLVARFTPTTGSSTFQYEWSYKRSNGNPSSGEINHQSGGNQDEMRVHQNDKDSVNRTSDLDNIGPGSTIAAGGITWTVLTASKSGSVYTFIVDPAARASEDDYNVLFTYFAPLPIRYVRAANHFQSTPTIQGFLATEYNPAALTLDDDAYGVDVELSDAVVSSEWSVMAYSGT